MGAKFTKEQSENLNIIENRVKLRPTKKEAVERAELELIQATAVRAICAHRAKESDFRLNIKALSVNEAWQGKRFKSKKYVAYSRSVLAMLPKLRMPERPYKISYEFGFSNKASDIDNPVKPLQDLLCQKYGFNDRDIFQVNIRKVIVRKGCEYVSFRIETL